MERSERNEGTLEKSTHSDIDKSINEKYEFYKRIGKGAYGTVWKGMHRSSQRVVAIKKIENAFSNETDAKRTYREVTYLKALKGHPNVVKLLNLHRAFNDKDIYLVFEYMEIDLHAYMKKGYDLEENQIKHIMYQLMSALAYIHSENIVHRDVKPANILLNRKCEAKIADFGLARNLNQINNENTSPLTEYIATRWYRPPEILLSSKSYTTSVDVWSVGCILSEMCLGVPLFPGKSTIHQLELIFTAIPKGKEDFGLDPKGICSSLVNWQPEKPRYLSDVLESLSSESKDLIQKLLTLAPQMRLSAHQALNHPYLSRQCSKQRPKKVQSCELTEKVGRCSVQDYKREVFKGINKETRPTSHNQKLMKKSSAVARQKLSKMSITPKVIVPKMNSAVLEKSK